MRGGMTWAGRLNGLLESVIRYEKSVTRKQAA